MASTANTVGRVGARRRAALDRRRFFTFTALGTLVPGLGLIAAGRKALGWFVLVLTLLGGAAAVSFVASRGRHGLLELAVNRSFLSLASVALIAVAVLWLLVAVVSQRALEPRGLGTGARLVGALIVVVLGSAVAGPLVMGSRYAYASKGLLSVFAGDGSSGASLTKPTISSAKNPWADKPRVNILLLGSDAGSDRTGTRPDSIILASLDTTTGKSTLFSLPRNLQSVPFPDVSGPAGELHRYYPRGFQNPAAPYQPDSSGAYLLNAVYAEVPAAHPDVFAGVQDPGAEAMKLAVEGALGVNVDYYAMVNLEGFSKLVDALGGITVAVRYDVPLGSVHVSPGSSTCTKPFAWVRKGQRAELNGNEALWYARTRCGPGPVGDDWDRMRRQRCVIGAIANEADPSTILRKYQQLASATQGMISTDLPADLLPALVELAPKVTSAGISSIAFTNDVINSVRPDYPAMRQLVQDALAPAAPGTALPSAQSSPSAAGPTATATSSALTPTPTGSPTGAATDTGQAQSLTAVC